MTQQMRPATSSLDAALGTLVAFNADQATRLGDRIEGLRRSSRSWLAVLEPLSVGLAAVAAFLVTALVQRYARLMDQRVKDLEHFSGRVAHDIRSPLASVGLALDMAQRGALGSEIGPGLERAGRTLQRVGQLVDGLLLFARAGGPPTEGATADVHEVLRGVVDEMRPAADKKGITLELDDAHASSVACTPGVLTSLASNLVANAIKYMGDAPVRRISVTARDLDSRMRLEVEDTGPGVPPEFRGRIFEAYVRSAGLTTPGLGLGLATVRRLAEAHGGSSGLETPRVGSRFWVELPRKKLAPAPRGRSRFALFLRRTS
jgi:signal transduction histidine kinase